MSKNKTSDYNAQPIEGDTSGLKGGTQPGNPADFIDPNHMPSEARVGSTAGPEVNNSAGVGKTRQRGDDTDATDAEVISTESGNRSPSPSEARTRGRDEANPAGGTHSGFNENDPAVLRKQGKSDGNMPQHSKHNPGEPGNAVHPNG